MHYIKTADSNAGAMMLAEYITRGLLGGRKLLWLVCGGSNIPITVSVMQRIDNTPLENLTIMLTDERYGVVGHTDSNAQQLTNAGFQPGAATFIPVLRNEALEETVEDYDIDYLGVTNGINQIIAQFGIGADGHIAGILPNSPAIQSSEQAVGYQAQEFTRITLTPRALAKVTTAFCFVYGETKLSAMTALHDQELSIMDEPAQLLKGLPDVYIYNDLMGDNA
jgi:6-phosphogluconolactonase/glucosamine-6-phosphate isomerase/deaminase